MPELPEVEYVVRSLNKMVSGQQLIKAKLLRERLAPVTTPARFSKLLSGSAIITIRRRGKFILFELDRGYSLMVHLRMSGRFLLLSRDTPEVKFTHAAFDLSSGRRLIFQDQRHFGLMKVVRTDHVAQDPSIVDLAPEPFSDGFSPDYLYRTLRLSRRGVKELIIDQSRVCGLGNIYASEALFRAGINPMRQARNVSLARAKRLHQCVIEILKEAIERFEDIEPHPIVIGEGVYGNGTSENWSVYDRENLPCSICRQAIRRIRQGGRSTYYCPKCQR